jgi:hypothetical protein
MTQQALDTANGMRISAPVLERVCKKMIEVILLCLRDAVRGTIYTIGPLPELRVVRIASGQKGGHTDEISWDMETRSDYDLPGKIWEEYRDRPGGILEAMAWCVERQRSWTADAPEHNIRSVRKQLEGKAGEDYHHMEPVLVKKADLWGEIVPETDCRMDSGGKAIWRDSPYATVAVIKIHFLPGTISSGDSSVRIIKELSESLGTQMLSLHAREVALEKEKQLAQERHETCNALAHEFRNLVPQIGFAYRAINNEISYLREAWEDLIHQHLPEQLSKKSILSQLSQFLKKLETECSAEISIEIASLERYQEQLMEFSRLPEQNEVWLRHKIRPLWRSVLTKGEATPTMRTQVEKLLERLRRSFYLGLDDKFRDKVNVIPEELKAKWVDLAYLEVNGRTGGMVKQYIELLRNADLQIPRQNHSLKNFIYLNALIEMIPEIEKKLNHRLELLKTSG